MAIGGIDIGTTGCKCTVYSENGEILSEAYREYSAVLTQESHTLDPNIVWDNVQVIIKEACVQVPDIAALAVSSFGEAAILLDDQDNPLLESMLYTDPRGDYECNQIIDDFNEDLIYEKTGLIPAKMYTLSKLLWLKKNKQQEFERCKRICLFQDFIVYKLSGVHQIDYSMASRTMAFDIRTYKWWGEIFDKYEISQELLPHPVPIGSAAGVIKTELAVTLGISENTKIVSACHDQIAAAIGTGSMLPGMAVDGTGTVECITPVFTDNMDQEVLGQGNYALVPFIGKFRVTYAFSLTAGALLKWYRNELAGMEAEEALSKGLNPYDVFNLAIKDQEPSGLLVLPHFSGAATPYMDAESVGAIVGLTTKTKKEDIYYSLMEGATYEMKVNLECLARAGITISEIRATGGGAASDVWMQIKADILNVPIVSVGAAQSGTLGAVMLAGVACGEYESLDEAAKVFVKIKKKFVPDPLKSKKYQKLFMQYEKLYEAVKYIKSTGGSLYE